MHKTDWFHLPMRTVKQTAVNTHTEPTCLRLPRRHRALRSTNVRRVPWRTHAFVHARNVVKEPWLASPEALVRDPLDARLLSG